jgi:hypothetical protein
MFKSLAPFVVGTLSTVCVADDVRMSTAFLPIPQTTLAVIPIDTDLDSREEVLLFYQSPARYIRFRADDRGRLLQEETVNISPFPLARVRAADVDLDGRTDFVTFSSDATVYEVHLNQGDGSFLPSADSPIPSIFTNEFNLADMDADDLPEIIALAPSHIAIYRNLGAGRFTAPSLSPINITGQRKDIAVARVQPFGAPAIAVLGDTRLYIYHPSDPSGFRYDLFQDLALPTEGVGLQAANIGSLGRDSFLVAAVDAAAMIAVHFNPTSQSYYAVMSPGTTVSQQNTSFAISRNPDRPIRAAFGFMTTGTPRLVTSDTTDAGRFQQLGPMPGIFSSFRRVAFADLLGDGNEHLVCASSLEIISMEPGPDGDFRHAGFYDPAAPNAFQLVPFPTRPLTYLASNVGFLPLSTYTIERTPTGPRVVTTPIPNVVGAGQNSRWVVVDVNGDGLDDLCHVANISQSGRVRWQLQNPDGSFASLQEIVVSLGTITNPVGADLNGDGFGDIAVLHSNGDVRLLYGQGSGQLSSPDQFALSNSASGGSLVAADLDHDGLTDLLCSNRLGSFSAALRIAYGLTPMSYRSPVSVDAPSMNGSPSVGQIDVADVNGDDILDIGIMSPTGPYLILSSGPRSYQDPVQVAARTGGLELRFRDMNGDGRPELVCMYQSLSIIASFDESGNVSNVHSFVHTPDPRTMTLVDVDEDTQPDVFFTTTIGASIVYNRSVPGCIADFVPDGTLDFFDVARFIADYNKQRPAADLDNDGLFNFFDITIFVQAFAAGCP